MKQTIAIKHIVTVCLGSWSNFEEGSNCFSVSVLRSAHIKS